MIRRHSAVLLLLCLLGNDLGFSVTNFPERTVVVKDCGKSIFTTSSLDRIVGGKDTQHGQYPWIVSLQEENGGYFEHICGAIILNENWILTAAHCIDFANKPWLFQVMVGLHKLSKQDAPTVQLHKISRITLHEDFDEDTFNNDIALLQTTKPIDLDGSKGYVNGICLPTATEDPTGFATVIGWGHTTEDGRKSDNLKEVAVPIISRDVCTEYYNRDPYEDIAEVNDNMICAGWSRKDSCLFDSGGPLFQTDNEGVSTLIGIVSFGNGCGRRYYPGIYTKVSNYNDWIEKIVMG